jgi:hypothetical protein
MDRSKTYLLSTGGAALILLGLILPWLTAKISLFGFTERESVSGFKLLGSFGESFGGFLVGISVLALIIILMATIVFSFMNLRDRHPSKQEALYVLIAGGVAAFLSILVAILMKSAASGLGEFREWGIRINTGIGFFFTLIGALVIAGAGFWAMQGAQGTTFTGGTTGWQPPQQPGQWQQPQQPPQWQQPQQPPQWQQPQQQPQWQEPQQPPQWQQPEQPPQWQQPEQPPQWQQPEQPPQWQQPEQPPQWQPPQQPPSDVN